MVLFCCSSSQNWIIVECLLHFCVDISNIYNRFFLIVWGQPCCMTGTMKYFQENNKRFTLERNFIVLSSNMTLLSVCLWHLNEPRWAMQSYGKKNNASCYVVSDARHFVRTLQCWSRSVRAKRRGLLYFSWTTAKTYLHKPKMIDG
jgi:hypothetical protein